jgi:23S rRNA (cytosine1962-C5)-methyltransferase
LGRYLALLVRKELNLKSMLWKLPVKRKHQEGDTALRLLYGFTPKAITFREGKLNLTVEPATGQKSGAFLDLRALRKWISQQNLNGGRVLNLFSYTGTLGLAAEKAGATKVLNVDISKGALETAAKFHRLQSDRQEYLAADIFEWLMQPERKKDYGKYQMIIIDPPMMASRTEQVPRVMQKYLQIYRAALPLLKPHGYIVVACCTSRVKRDAFKKLADSAFLATATCRFVQSIAPEEDHPVAFTEGDYLKILIYQKKPGRG